MEHHLQELNVPRAASDLALDLEHSECSPSMYRRIHVREVPLVRRHLSISLHVPVAGKEHELAFCELRIDERKRDGMEREIPDGEEWIFPLVGHRDDIGDVEVLPSLVADEFAIGRGWRLSGVPLDPLLLDELVVLFRPEKYEKHRYYQ